MVISYKVNMAGPYHEELGLPCQDSFAVMKVSDELFIGAVADGLGSELYSDVGSAVAVKKAVEYCARHITKDMTYEDIRKIMNNSFVYAYKEVLMKAAEDGNDSDEYDTTLCMVIYDGQQLYYAQSGDSGIVALLQNGEYYRVTSQQRDEEGRVFPLCWGPEKWEFGYVDEPVSAVMVMTDGVFEQICPPLMRHGEVDINIPLARKFLDRFDCTEEEVSVLEDAAYKYLKNFPSTLLDDDKTVVVLINTELLPEIKEEEYYAIPDWRALRTEAEKKLFETDNNIKMNGEGTSSNEKVLSDELSEENSDGELISSKEDELSKKQNNHVQILISDNDTKKNEVS